MFLWATGRGPQDGSFPTASPFVIPISYDEFYDGNGSIRMYLRNSPIQGVILLQIGYHVIPQSTLWGQQGFVIDGSKESISLRGGSGGGSTSFSFGQWNSWNFWKGIQNVHTTYIGGYNFKKPTVLDVILPVTSPPVAANVQVPNSPPWLVDNGVTYKATGTALTLVTGSPTQGQYTVSSTGLYGFSYLDNGAEVLIAYTAAFPPPDIEIEVRKTVSLNYMQRDWIGMKSQSMANGAGSVTYINEVWDPSMKILIDRYTRWAIV
jgi:hypothetical protein